MQEEQQPEVGIGVEGFLLSVMEGKAEILS